MSLFSSEDDTSLFFSMLDPEHDWSRISAHPFELDGFTWPTVEHYFQAMKYTDIAYQTKIRQATTDKASKLGNTWFKRKRADWKKIQQVVMTRALYTKCKTYPDIAKGLLDTGTQKLIEDSLYDYEWGCGRDRRGSNLYGQVLMNIRKKLTEEQVNENS